MWLITVEDAPRPARVPLHLGNQLRHAGKPLVRPQPKAKTAAQAAKGRPNIQFKTKNWVLMALGIVTIIAGYVLLSKGSITLAPILLVAGYCVIIPVAILVR